MSNQPEPAGYAEALAELEDILADLESADVDVDVLATKVQRATQRLDTAASTVARAPQRLEPELRHLDGLAGRVRLLDPVHTMARGWSITRTAGGHTVRSADDLQPGDEIITTFATGTARSRRPRSARRSSLRATAADTRWAMPVVSETMRDDAPCTAPSAYRTMSA